MAFAPLVFRQGRLKLLDQRVLPGKKKWIECRSAEEVARAIQTMVIRGAPAIGIAGAYGLYVGVRSFKGSPDQFLKVLEKKAKLLREARPTGANLAWAVNRILKKVEAEVKQVLAVGPPLHLLKRLILNEAQTIHKEDELLCRLIGKYGASLFQEGDSVLTHCNAGGLATSGFGTALAVFYTLREQGKHFTVYATETRPLLQGARLTAWELAQSKIPCTLICESAVASLMRQRKVGSVVVGADRIAANGDTANKIGTYGIALLARSHGIPFYVAAPSSTFDASLPSGEGIPIEVRKPEEITEGFGKRTAPRGIRVENPAFDVTPHGLITGFITEKGVIRPPYEENLRILAAGAPPA
jgi:methylthioribose-1-phosphate isomerase